MSDGQPATLGSNTLVSLGWVAGILVAAATAGAAHFRLQTLDTDYREHVREEASARKAAEEKSHGLELKQVGVEGDLRRISAAIESIDKKLDRLTERRTRDDR